MNKLKVFITIGETIFDAFKSYCLQKGRKVSTKVEQMMRENLKNQPLQAFRK